MLHGKVVVGVVLAVVGAGAAAQSAIPYIYHLPPGRKERQEIHEKSLEDPNMARFVVVC